MADYGHITGYRRAKMVASDHWVAVAGFWATHAYAATYAKNLHGTLYDDRNIGTFAPTCTSVEIQENMHGSSGKSLLLAHYETVRKPGRGKLIVTPGQHSRARYKDLLGDIVSGVDREAGKRYSVVEGNAAAIEADSTFIVQTAVLSGGVSQEVRETVEGRRGAINSNAMPNFPGTAPYTLLYLGVKLMPSPLSTLVYMDHIFLYNQRGWNDDLRIQVDQWQIVQQPVLDKDNVVATDLSGNPILKPVKRLLPATEISNQQVAFDADGNPYYYYNYSEAPLEKRQLYVQHNFSDINAIVAW